MQEPNDRLIVTLTLKELEGLMVKAVKAAPINAPPPKVEYTLDEASALLNVTPQRTRPLSLHSSSLKF